VVNDFHAFHIVANDRMLDIFLKYLKLIGHVPGQQLASQEIFRNI